MDWFTDVNACQQKVDDLRAHASYVEAARALENGDPLAPAQEKLMRQMATFTSRLSILREESLQAVGGARKRPWLDAVDYDELPGNDRQELTRAGLEKDSFKGVRKQFDEVKHHYGAHVATGAALDEARKALEGTQLPSNVVEALAFCVETAEKGVARARERGKVLAMVVDEGTEVGWKMAEKLERRSYAENDEEDKACRRARKEVKAENEAKAKANAAKQKARDQRPRPAVQQQLPFSPPPAAGAGGLDVEFSEEELENAVAIVEQGVAVPRVAGRLRDHASFWRTFVRSTYVMSWIERGFSLRFSSGRPPPSIHLPNHSSANLFPEFVTGALRECELMGAVRRAARKPKVVLPIMVDNNGVKLRLIFNGKYLNSFLDFPRFRYEPLQPFVDVLRPDDGLFYWDYKSGYYHVDLHEGSRQYVAVEWLGVFYEFCVLPFGLAPACWVFTKINRELVGRWRARGVRVHPYVDDFICAVRAPSLTDPAALGELRSVIRDVELAGWLVSETKSQLFLTRELVHIGVGIDLQGRRLFVPDKAVAKIRACAEQILSCFRRVPLRLVAKFAGLVNAQWFVLGALCKLFTRSAAVLIADTLCWGTWASHVPGSDAFRRELEFWLGDEFMQFQRGIWEPRGSGLQLEVEHCDASEVAWGSWLESALGPRGGPELEGHSYLYLEDRLRSSTHRELRGILDSLRGFSVSGRLRGKRVLVICDNQAVHFVLEDGSRHEELHALAVEIFWFCMAESVVLSSLWVPREFEVRSDGLSKIQDHDDWMLNPAIFQFLDPWIAGGYWHTCDRFATDKNCLLPRFNSAWYCPGTSGVDTFSQSDWREHVNWCNPPFRLIGRLLLFLQTERAAATVVAPMWVFQPWWVLLCPDGVHLADCVVQWTELQPSADTFLPGTIGTGEFWDGLRFSETDPLERQLLRDIQGAVLETRKQGTIDGYARAFVRYQRWCAERDPPRTAVVADPVTVALYLQYVANAAKTFSVVKTASGMIFRAHEYALVPADRNPTGHRLVAAVREAAHRRLGDRRLARKEPLEYEFVVRGARKTDKYRFGQVVEVVRAAPGQELCPVELLQQWVDIQISRGVLPHEPLFQQIDGRRFARRPEEDCLSGGPLDYQQLRRYLFRMLAEASGLDADELRQLYGTQSLRSGGATAVAEADQVSDHEFNQFGGWSSSAACATYKASSLDRRLAVTRSMPHAQISDAASATGGELTEQEKDDVACLEQLGVQWGMEAEPAEGQLAQ
ncbi:hypothetical protein CYMTET_38307 [Cymbomonas tetramitiformis]|uniref:Reverse transcriptase domain-containing protein n=1 Tax=Cymbomonas tetramitiformis TaxID=36881 RepID=A0AAE0CED6_9CHLO|nr:hypothetical protein CYMTET_38307 [Cymbomonas tetramitiformis]